MRDLHRRSVVGSHGWNNPARLLTRSVAVWDSSNFHKSVWTKARAAAGMPELHFHDLRHTGGTLSAASGATLKELMARLGHSSVRAAMIYQHATRDRDQAIAKALGAFVREVRGAFGELAEGRERGGQGA